MSRSGHQGDKSREVLVLVVQLGVEALLGKGKFGLLEAIAELVLD
jgi:hypothetical protein